MVAWFELIETTAIKIYGKSITLLNIVVIQQVTVMKEIIMISSVE